MITSEFTSRNTHPQFLRNLRIAKHMLVALVNLRAAQGIQPKSLWLPLLTTIALYTAICYLFRIEMVPLDVSIASLALAAICLFPFFLWRAAGSQRLPMVELICLSYALQYSLPVFLQHSKITIFSQAIHLPWGLVREVLFFAVAGVTCLLIGYWTLTNVPALSLVPRLDLPLRPESRQLYLIALISAGLLFTTVSSLQLIQVGSLGMVVRMATSQLYVGIALLTYYIYRGVLQHIWWTFLLYATVFLSFILGLMTGFMQDALIGAAVFIISRWSATGELAWRYLVIGILAFFVLNSAKGAYRQQAWYGDNQPNAVERATIWVRSVGKVTAGLQQSFNLRSEESELYKTIARLNQIHKFAYVRTMSPAVVPFYKGDTYTYFVVTWIPRFLWPEKPVASEAGNRLDIDFQLKRGGDTHSIGIGMLSEAYANYGLLGICLFMFLQGAIFGLLHNMLNSPHSEGGQAIYIVIMVYFLNGIGSSAVVLFGAIFQQMIAYVVAIRPFCSGFSHANQ